MKLPNANNLPTLTRTHRRGDPIQFEEHQFPKLLNLFSNENVPTFSLNIDYPIPFRQCKILKLFDLFK